MLNICAKKTQELFFEKVAKPKKYGSVYLGVKKRLGKKNFHQSLIYSSRRKKKCF